MSDSTPIIVPKGMENKSRIALTMARVHPQDFPFALHLGSLTFAVSVDFYGSSGIRNLRIT